MSVKNSNPLGLVAFIISLVPGITLVPVLFHVSLSSEVQSAWSMVNIFCVAAGFALALVCLRNPATRNLWSILAMTASCLFLLLIIGIGVTAIALNIG